MTGRSIASPRVFMSAANESQPAAFWKSRLRRLVPVALVVAVLGLVYAMGWHRDLSFETLLRHRATIDGFIAEHRGTAILVFAALYTVTAALALPTGLFLALVGGVLFGALVGGL